MDADPARDRLEDERERLEGMRAALENEHLTTRSETDRVPGLSAHAQQQADLAADTFNRERDLSILEHIDAELADVEHALGRLDDGTYGTCEACGRPISSDRLEAVPAARFCLDDQAGADRR